jgi:hypothetical protein
LSPYRLMASGTYDGITSLSDAGARNNAFVVGSENQVSLRGSVPVASLGVSGRLRVDGQRLAEVKMRPPAVAVGDHSGWSVEAVGGVRSVR